MAARRATAPSSSSAAATTAASPSTTATTTVHKPRVVKKARKSDGGAAVVRPTKKRKSQSAETLNDVGSAAVAAGSVSTPFAPVEKKTKKTKAKPVEPPTTDASYFTASQFDVEINSVDDTAGEEDGDDEEAEETQEEEEEADGEDEEDEEEEEDEEIAAPVVFQCGTCRCIFGDSYSFVSSNADLLLVTLSAVTNVAVGPEPLTSKEGPDLGSSFLELLCKQCQTVLGRQYLTTPWRWTRFGRSTASPRAVSRAISSGIHN
ncbi:hypothetical protein PINS_up023701 [Pythium insidiosum]|nr:hypothetical protein PINS_up023701 [Pythium insidiosum]